MKIENWIFLFRASLSTALETVELSFTVKASFQKVNRRNSIDELRIERGFANGLKQKLKDAVDKMYKICISALN